MILKSDRIELGRNRLEKNHIQSSSRSIQGGEWTNPVDCIESKLLLCPGRAKDEVEELELLPVVLLVLLLKLTTPVLKINHLLRKKRSISKLLKFQPLEVFSTESAVDGRLDWLPELRIRVAGTGAALARGTSSSLSLLSVRSTTIGGLRALFLAGGPSQTNSNSFSSIVSIFGSDLLIGISSIKSTLTVFLLGVLLPSVKKKKKNNNNNNHKESKMAGNIS